MMNTSASASARNRSPFTATQWQELEHQALIFKYMVSGIPIPPDLLYSVKRSLDSSISSRLYPHHPIGWGCFEMGFGRKVDPEPGRCRRTDGKKWRCSKEAYPDSKYCERHMHRGRNRSRKPVETHPHHHHPYHDTTTAYPFLYSHSSSSRQPLSGFLPQNNTTHQLFLDSGSYSQADKDYRYLHGTREGVDERAFFPEASGTARSLPDSYQRLTMGSYKGYPHKQFQSLTDSSKQQQEQHCFVLGTDFKSQGQVKTEEKSEIQKPLHHFFGEWTPKNTDTWLDLASNSRVLTDD
ncbi:growth-regulating factor 5-like [Fagus crenata]